MSGLLDELQQYSHSPTGEPLCIYGDPAYPQRIWLQNPYRDGHLTDEQHQFNASMSSVRVAVEWVFGDIVTYFALLDYKRDLKIGLSPVGKLYSGGHCTTNCNEMQRPIKLIEDFGRKFKDVRAYCYCAFFGACHANVKSP